MSEEPISPTSIIILSIGLAGNMYLMYQAYETKAVSLFMNDVKVGPYTLESDPLIFWSVIGLQVVVALAMLLYLYKSWEPPQEVLTIPDEDQSP